MSVENQGQHQVSEKSAPSPLLGEQTKSLEEPEAVADNVELPRQNELLQEAKNAVQVLRDYGAFNTANRLEKCLSKHAKRHVCAHCGKGAQELVKGYLQRVNRLGLTPPIWICTEHIYQSPSVISGNDEQGAASVTPTPVAASSLPPGQEGT